MRTEKLTICCEPLQKARVRSGSIKPGLNPTVVGNICSHGLRYVFLVYVPTCQFSFSRLGFGGSFFLISPFLVVVYSFFLNTK